MSVAIGLVHHTVAQLRCSTYVPSPACFTDGLSAAPAIACTGTGYVTASPAFPFDVLTGPGAFGKSTVLVIDMDAVVADCARVLRWCADTQVSQGVSSGEAPISLRTPTLERLLCCFVKKVCLLVERAKVQVELVLGSCEGVLVELNSVCSCSPLPGQLDTTFKAPEEKALGVARLDDGAEEDAENASVFANADCFSATANGAASPARVETLSLWLQVYQTLVLALSSDATLAGRASLYTSAWPGYTAAASRVRLHTDSALARNLQLFPLLWSTDARAFFAAAEHDAVVTPWLSMCARELTQLCGQPLPPSLLLPCENALLTSALNTSTSTALPDCDKDVTGRVLVRHGPSTARRLGLRSAAYLPTLYALLALHDARHVDPSSRGAQGNRRYRDTAAASAARVVQAQVARAAALVNDYCGILHVELVGRWVVEGDVWAEQRKGSEQQQLQRPTHSMAVPLDLATPLWAAQHAAATVTTSGVAIEMLSPSSWSVQAVWVNGVWRHRRLPPLPCGDVSTTAAASSTSRRPLRDSMETTATAAPTFQAYFTTNATNIAAARATSLAQCTPILQERQLVDAVLARLAPLRQRVLHVVQAVACQPASEGEASESEVATGQLIDAVFGHHVHLNAILAEPLLDFATLPITSEAASSVAPSVVAETADAAPQGGRRGLRDAATLELPHPPLPLFATELAAFQTRATLDEVREDVRPEAQLTFVALSVLWRARLLRESDCLRMFAHFLFYLEEEKNGCANPEWKEAISAEKMRVCVQLAEAADVNAGGKTPRGVWGWEVEAWWHAVSCVTLLHAVSATITRATPQPPFAPHAGPKMLCDPASVFSGCLPSASYGATSQGSFLAYLQRTGRLLSFDATPDSLDTLKQQCVCSVVSDSGMEASTAALQVLNPEEFDHFRRGIECPAFLIHELIVAHRIWTSLAKTLSH